MLKQIRLQRVSGFGDFSRLLMPKLFITGIVLFLLLGAGYGLATIQAARSIPWDCSDWQAFAHADRTTSILESVAENRGKTLYCGIDQSDTFGKAETWQAGKDRNERDDTIYSGERGIFRGFIAAQEGWLTDGESGVTGVSIDRIFEFPREKKKRRTRIKRLEVPESPERIAPSPIGDLATTVGAEGLVRRLIRNLYWTSIGSSDPRKGNTADKTAYWTQRAKDAALAYCRSRGYPRALRVAPGALPANFILSDTNTQTHQGWGYADFSNPSPNNYSGRAYQYVRWSATCVKKVRRTRK